MSSSTTNSPVTDSTRTGVGGGSVVDQKSLRLLSNICFVLGFVSIIASIIVWFTFKSPDPAHGERFGIFVGLWAPTFFILSDRFARPFPA